MRAWLSKTLLRKRHETVPSAPLKAASGQAAVRVQAPQARKALACEALAAILHGQFLLHLAPPHPDAAAIAQAMLDCVNGTHVDFLGLDAQARLYVHALPPAGWAVLQEFVKAESGSGIAFLKVFVPRGVDTLDLRGLHTEPVSLTDVEIHSEDDFARRLTVTAPLGAKVRARVRDFDIGAVREKSLVQYVDGDSDLVMHLDASGEWSALTKPLGGLIYEREPTDFQMEALWTGENAHELARWLNLNTKAAMPIDADGDMEAQLNLDPIVCRHLAVKWLADRIEHLRANALAMREGQPTKRFSYENYQTTEAISRNISQQQQREYGELHNQRSIPFSIPDFGNLLAGELECMRVGQNAHFALLPKDHVMAIELRVKEGLNGEPEYVVNFYDPNRTAMHRRVVVSDPAQLRQLPLEAWISKGLHRPSADRARHGTNYYLLGGPLEMAGEMVAWPPDSGHSTLHRALRNGKIAVALRETRKIIAKRVGLLAESNFYEPMLHVLARTPPDPCEAPWIAEHYTAIRAHLGEILAAHSLAEERRQEVCASALAESTGYGQEPSTAARQAIDYKNPGMAGAMWLAITDMDVEPALTRQRLGQLGVGVDEILQALEQAITPQNQAWMEPMIQEIRQRSRAMAAQHE